MSAEAGPMYEGDYPGHGSKAARAALDKDLGDRKLGIPWGMYEDAHRTFKIAYDLGRADARKEMVEVVKAIAEVKRVK